MVETLIKNGRVYDGTGSDWFGASVAIEKAKVKLISGDTSSLKAKRVIDATGKIVCPGFVDMHAHSTMVILKHPEHEPKVLAGERATESPWAGLVSLRTRSLTG